MAKKNFRAKFETRSAGKFASKTPDLDEAAEHNMEAQSKIDRVIALQELEARNTAEQTRLLKEFNNELCKSNQSIEQAKKQMQALEERLDYLESQISEMQNRPMIQNAGAVYISDKKVA